MPPYDTEFKAILYETRLLYFLFHFLIFCIPKIVFTADSNLYKEWLVLGDFAFIPKVETCKWFGKVSMIFYILSQKRTMLKMFLIHVAVFTEISDRNSVLQGWRMCIGKEEYIYSQRKLSTWEKVCSPFIKKSNFCKPMKNI